MVNVVDYLLEQGSLADADQIEAPRNIRQMIERNLQRLTPDEQCVLEAASIAGAEFSAAAVAAALEHQVSQIEACCVRLSRHGQFVTRRGAFSWPDGTASAIFRFHHALYQNVLYDSIPEGDRADYHRRIAERVERAYGEQAVEVAAELAHHYTMGRRPRAAFSHWQRAGQRAIERSAHTEAIGHLMKALEMLALLPVGSERQQQELTVQIALGPAFIAAKGYAAPEVQRTFARARELCNILGDTTHLFAALYGQWWFLFVAAKLEPARIQARELLDYARRQADPILLLTAHRALGYTLFDLGEFASACQEFEEAMRIYRKQLHYHAARYGGTDPGVGSLCFLAMALWYRGYPDQALARISDAVSLAEELSHPLSLSGSLNFAARVAQFRREVQVCRARAEASILVSTKLGFSYWLAEATVLSGWALAAEGENELGLNQMRQGMGAYAATGGRLWRLYYLALMAEGCGAVGRFEDALTELAEAIGLVQSTDEHEHEAELYRLRGELSLKQPTVAGVSKRILNESAERDFRSAITIAINQQAKSLELRTATSLARLLASQSKHDEARTMLADIYNWFTEGFDTRDLVEAKALLDELATTAAGAGGVDRNANPA